MVDSLNSGPADMLGNLADNDQGGILDNIIDDSHFHLSLTSAN